MDPPPCSLQGNGDLYGLGIRVGIYCQWTSSWVRMLVDEESAEEVHGVNAIFVFAVIVATILAQTQRDVRPVELYIMLQISLGFFVTVLSTVGVRNHFLRPARIEVLWRHFRRVVGKRRRDRESREKVWTRERFRQLFREERRRSRNVFKAVYAAVFAMADEYRKDAAARQYVSNPNFEVPLEYLTPFKPGHISWVGVLWRTAILGIVAGFNVYFWFYIASQPERGDACGPATIFIFSKQPLHAPVIVLSQIVAVVVVVVVLPVCLFLAAAAAFLVSLLTVCTTRDVLYAAFPGSARVTRRVREKLLPPLERVQYYLRVTEFVLKRTPSFRGFISLVWLLILAFQLLFFFVKLLDPKSLSIHALIRAAISLFTPKPPEATAMHETDHGLSKSPRSNSSYLLLSIIWNALVFLGIVWFILCIELTLGWSNIRNVNEIKSTGQLIPFIIGCVSTCQVLKQVVLIGLRKLFPDWGDYKLEAAYTARGGIKFHINHCSHQEVESTTVQETETAPSTPSRLVGPENQQKG